MPQRERVLASESLRRSLQTLERLVQQNIYHQRYAPARVRCRVLAG